MSPQYSAPGDQEFQGALAAEDQRQDEDDKHQDHAKYEGIGNDLFGGEVKFLADPPPPGPRPGPSRTGPHIGAVRCSGPPPAPASPPPGLRPRRTSAA